MLHDPTFWTLVAMLVLVGFLTTKGKPVLQMIVAAIDQQIDAIRDRLKHAQQDLTAAKSQLHKTKDAFAKAMRSAEDIRLSAESEARALLEDSRRGIDRLIRTRQSSAQERIRSAEEKALHEIRSDVARQVVAKLRSRFAKDQHGDESLADLATVMARLHTDITTGTHLSADQQMTLDQHWRKP
jgi:F0F1-type ATP synthase membrane subunit b/b'